MEPRGKRRDLASMAGEAAVAGAGPLTAERTHQALLQSDAFLEKSLRTPTCDDGDGRGKKKMISGGCEWVW
jgi:hypothetical protein